MGIHKIDLLERGPSLAAQLAEMLRQEINLDRLGAGGRLPTEQSLAKAYGVSRPIVREAIGRLKHEGLVVSRQGLGAFVAEGGSSVFRLDAINLEDRAELKNIIELLVPFESAATELAAQRRSKRQLAEIKAALDAMRSAIDRNEPGIEEDVAFHVAITAATGNPLYRDLAVFFDNRVRKFIRIARSNTARTQKLIENVQLEHLAIYEAIAARDAQAARETAERHLVNASLRLARHLGPPAPKTR